MTSATSSLWVERYRRSRPAKIDDVEHQEEPKNILKGVLQSQQLPNLLFYGPAGTGKTSLILAFAKEVFGSEFRSRVLEMNASDERGIDVVRQDLKSFSRLISSSSASKQLPPWKIIILDEADMMTTDAQNALRRVIEDTSTHTRFVIICNYLPRIISPIASRCVVCRFQAIPEKNQLQKLREIAHNEQMNISEEALRRLVEISRGDMRLAINTLQSAGMASLQHITIDTINDIAGQPPPEICESLLKQLKASSVSMEDLQTTAKSLIGQGWNLTALLEQVEMVFTRHISSFSLQLAEQLIFDSELSVRSKSEFLFQIAASQQRIESKGSEILELLLLLIGGRSLIQSLSRMATTKTVK